MLKVKLDANVRIGRDALYPCAAELLALKIQCDLLVLLSWLAKQNGAWRTASHPTRKPDRLDATERP